MATYLQIQKQVQKQNSFTPKTCWIAHVLSDQGLTQTVAPNRESKAQRKYPCPPNRRPAIMAALKHFDMI